MKELLIEYEFFKGEPQTHNTKSIQLYLKARVGVLEKYKGAPEEQKETIDAEAREAGLQAYIEYCEANNMPNVEIFKGLVTCHNTWKFLTWPPEEIIKETLNLMKASNPNILIHAIGLGKENNK